MKTKKVTCIITGKSFLFNKDYYDKKIAQHDNNEELFQQTYISKQAKDLLMQGYSVDQIRKQIGGEDLPQVDLDYIDKLTKNKYGIKKDTTFSTITSFTVFETDPDVKKFINNLTLYA